MKEETKRLLEKYNQQHILEYLKLLTEEEKNELEKQILKIDFEQLKDLYESTRNQPQIEEKKIEHIPYIDKEKLSNDTKQELEKVGGKIIASGAYAVLTMAGGQGTRLGHIGPKGSYAVNTQNGTKYLFEIIIDTLKRAKEKYGVTIPWYIMTSKENNDETLNFLEEHNYFGYDKTKVTLFIQGELPLVDTKGKIILDKNKKIKEAANGNGGIYAAVKNSGLLDKMKRDGVEWIFISNVDNILSNFVDPILLGLTIKENNKIAAKSVAKNDPYEKAGVFCKMNNKAKVIEYIDLPSEMAEQRDKNGELVYGELNISTYLYNRSAFEELAQFKLPYHAAFKKSSYLDITGKVVEPEEPNIYKFEAFIFDAFVKYDNITILRVKREEEFAPVKNRTGVDSPETATKLYNEFYKEV